MWIDDFSYVLKLVAKILLLSEGKPVVVQSVHALAESATAVVERSHTTHQFTATAFERVARSSLRGVWDCIRELALLGAMSKVVG